MSSMDEPASGHAVAPPGAPTETHRTATRSSSGSPVSWTECVPRSLTSSPDEPVIRWRRHFHAHPELGFEEHDTAAFVVDQLRELRALTVHEGVAGTGVVADLPGRPGAPVIALRADMDALPIDETTDLPFRSRAPGRMHACGHDGHIAMLLGAAFALATDGSNRGIGVRFLFQPCEETVGLDGRTGAQRMIDEGALEGVSSAFALHLEPSLPVGSLRLASGPVMACTEAFRGRIRGSGGHGARPERSADPVRMLAVTLMALHSIVSRRVSPLDSAVVSVCRITAGSAANVLPGIVDLEGTLRSLTPETRDLLRVEVEQAFSAVSALGGSYSLDIRPENPSLVNDAGACRTVAEAARALWTDVTIVEGPYGMLGEDFAFVAQRVPAAMAMLGCARAVRRELHTADFDLDERALLLGVALLCLIVDGAVNTAADVAGP